MLIEAVHASNFFSDYLKSTPVLNFRSGSTTQTFALDQCLHHLLHFVCNIAVNMK